MSKEEFILHYVIAHSWQDHAVNEVDSERVRLLSAYALSVWNVLEEEKVSDSLK